VRKTPRLLFSMIKAFVHLLKDHKREMSSYLPYKRSVISKIMMVGCTCLFKPDASSVSKYQKSMGFLEPLADCYCVCSVAYLSLSVDRFWKSKASANCHDRNKSSREWEFEFHFWSILCLTDRILVWIHRESWTKKNILWKRLISWNDFPDFGLIFDFLYRNLSCHGWPQYLVMWHSQVNNM